MLPCSRFRCGLWVLWVILAGCLLPSGCGRDGENHHDFRPMSGSPMYQEDSVASSQRDMAPLQFSAESDLSAPLPAAPAPSPESEFIDRAPETALFFGEKAPAASAMVGGAGAGRAGITTGGSGMAGGGALDMAAMPGGARHGLELSPTGNAEQTPGAAVALAAGSEMRKERGARATLTRELQPGEELWVISVPPGGTPHAQVNTGLPGCGSLLAEMPDQRDPVPVPLKHTAVRGSIDGYIATVDVTQQFHNPWESKIEAVYVFPLPENAAVTEFVMTVGERRIRGIIREREKAEAIYRQARSQGLVASLLTQQRPNVFTQKVANLEPGRQIDISIRYFHPLRYDGGEYEFVFPMVVGPRYNPPHSVDGVGAAAHGASGSSGQGTEVTYLAPDQRSGHDISLALEIRTGVPVESLTCTSHAVELHETSDSHRRVVLSGGSVIPNRDFVLRCRVAGSEIRTALMTQQDRHGQYFSLMVYPPADLTQVERSPMELVFVVDCSGSMNGRPLVQARAAVDAALRHLTSRDTFQIINFSSSASQLGSAPVIADEQNLRKGREYLNSLHGSGGTEMQLGLNAALDFPHDEGRFRLVTFLTDGFIGNEQEILETLSRKLGASRVFSFGVGEAPNRFLMDRMAVLGRGAVSYLGLNDEAADRIDQFFRQISHPALTDTVIDFGEMQVSDVYPARLPDLFVGRPILVTGRYAGKPAEVRLNGRVGTRPVSVPIRHADVQADAAEDRGPSSLTSPGGIAAVWARHKIADLMMSAIPSPERRAQVRQQVTETALNYGLISDFTAFVAVDSLSHTTGAFGTTVVVPVPLPEGVRYDTTVSN